MAALLQLMVVGCGEPKKENPMSTPERKEILGERKMGTPEEQAKAIAWALDSMLPWYAPHPKKGSFVFRTEDEMGRVWLDQGGGRGKLPKVDFGSRMVVAMFIDEGSYTEAPRVTTIQKVGGRIEVRWAVGKTPFPRINPCIVISIPKDDAEVVFVAE
jgi:hypothetical protein